MINFSTKTNNQLQGMVEDSDEMKEDFKDLTKSDHVVLGAGVHFTYVFEHSFMPEIYSVFCIGKMRNSLSPKKYFVKLNHLSSKTITFTKFLPKMREREFP